MSPPDIVIIERFSGHGNLYVDRRGFKWVFQTPQEVCRCVGQPGSSRATDFLLIHMSFKYRKRGPES